MWSHLSADSVSGLPEPQRVAACTAFGLELGPAPNPFLVGLAMLNGLADLAEQTPLFLVVDDAQWLDRASASALAFVARRLRVEPVSYTHLDVYKRQIKSRVELTRLAAEYERPTSDNARRSAVAP